MFHRLTALAVIAIVVVAACGSSGGGSATKSDYVNAIVKTKSSSDLTKDLSATEMHCVATKLVDAVGVDTLNKAGITPKEAAAAKGLKPLDGKLSAAQKKAMVDALVGNECFDFGALIKKSGTSASLNKIATPKLDCLFQKLFATPAAQDAFSNSLITGKSVDFNTVFGDQSQLTTVMGQCNISPSDLSG